MSASSDTWTIGRLLEWTKTYLSERDVDNPRLDAEVLLAHARGCPRIELYTTFDEVASDDERSKFRALVSQRAQGKPVAHLVGYKEFFSLTFEVTSDVLIPRPETEMLVMAVLDAAKEIRVKKPLAIADVGTGSGCIAVAVAKQLPNCSVTAIDVSPAALTVAARNAAKHEVADRVELIESDLFAAVDAQKQFDIIVSNPPYVTEAEYTKLSSDVCDFEPKSALVPGPRGTEIIERLINAATTRLKSGGWLFIEISPTIAKDTMTNVAAIQRWHEPRLQEDLAKLPRVLIARRD